MTVLVCPFHTTKNATDWYSFKGGANQVIGSKELEFKETEHFNFIQSSAQEKGPVRLTCPMVKQGSKKVPSSSLGQIDFFAGQVIFKAYLLNVPGSRQVILWQNHLWKLARSGLGQGKCESWLPGKGQTKLKFLLSPRKGTYTRQVILQLIIN